MGRRTEDAAISFTGVDPFTLNVVIQARSSESCTCLVHFQRGKVKARDNLREQDSSLTRLSYFKCSSEQSQ